MDGTYIFGQGVNIYGDKIGKFLGKFNIIPLHLAVPSASTVALLGFKRFLSEGKGDDIKNLVPNYCRKSEAEINFQG